MFTLFSQNNVDGYYLFGAGQTVTYGNFTVVETGVDLPLPKERFTKVQSFQKIDNVNFEGKTLDQLVNQGKKVIIHYSDGYSEQL